MRSCPAVSGRVCSALERRSRREEVGRSQTNSGSSVTTPRRRPCGVSSCAATESGPRAPAQPTRHPGPPPRPLGDRVRRASSIPSAPSSGSALGGAVRLGGALRVVAFRLARPPVPGEAELGRQLGRVEGRCRRLDVGRADDQLVGLGLGRAQALARRDEPAARSGPGAAGRRARAQHAGRVGQPAAGRAQDRGDGGPGEQQHTGHEQEHGQDVGADVGDQAVDDPVQGLAHDPAPGPEVGGRPHVGRREPVAEPDTVGPPSRAQSERARGEGQRDRAEQAQRSRCAAGAARAARGAAAGPRPPPRARPAPRSARPPPARRAPRSLGARRCRRPSFRRARSPGTRPRPRRPGRSGRAGAGRAPAVQTARGRRARGGRGPAGEPRPAGSPRRGALAGGCHPAPFHARWPDPPAAARRPARRPALTIA